MDLQKYKIILDNLLNIKSVEPDIFTHTNNKNHFDLFSILRQDEFDEVIYNEKFEVSLLNGNLTDFINELRKTKTIEDLIYLNDKILKEKILKQNNIDTNNDFTDEQFKLLNKLELIQQKTINVWKLLNVTINDIIDLRNIWPLHIGFLFLSVRVEEKVVYAPLFFKEAYITFKNGLPYLTCDSEIKINEKLMFFLNNNGFYLNFENLLNNQIINDVVKMLQRDWKNLYTLPNNIYSNFINLNKEEINNLNIIFHPGVVLGIYNPSGGYARARMKEIIENNELDDIIQVEFNKTKYKNAIDKYLYNPEFSLFNLTKSNLSQDKAVISALCQNTIIQGPPGTGKSQTIVNLLSNILIYGKTAIVASQKKAALEVIQERLGKLSAFCLFNLNTKEKKKNFYKPIKEYLKMLEHFNNKTTIEKSPFINKFEINYLNNINNFLDLEDTDKVFKSYYYLSKYKIEPNYYENAILLSSIPKDLKFTTSKIDYDTLTYDLLNINNIRFKPFFPKYWKIRKISKNLKNHFDGFSGSLAKVVKLFQDVNIKNTSKNNPFIKVNDSINTYQKIDYNQFLVKPEIIEKLVCERIVNKVNNFSIEQMRLYKEFAQSVRVENLPPTKFIKKYSEMIKNIFPILVATPDSDLSVWNKNEFDYGILDEASQIFIEYGLPILYLSKIKVLSGDNEQMKPTNWFSSRSSDETIFGTVDSLLDYVSSLGVYEILLDKNYRSNSASLMTFSSKYFYNSQLDVVNLCNNKEKKPIEVIEVQGQWLDNKNIVEKDKVIEIVSQNLDKYNKIILLSLNAKQKEYILEEIYKNHLNLQKAIESKQLLLRNLENIQGDEADLVVITVAYDKYTKFSSAYVSRYGGKNSLNVAISRAKEKMIVVKTIKSNELTISDNSTEDLRIFKEWLEFLELGEIEKTELLLKNVNNQNIKELKKAKKHIWFKSLVIEEFEKEINNPNIFQIKEDYNIGSLNIDLVILKNKTPYKCIIFDTFEYGSTPIEEYVTIRDKYRYLCAKKYDTYIINPISWVEFQNQINNWFELSEEELIEIQENTSKNQYLLEDNFQYKESENNNEYVDKTFIKENDKSNYLLDDVNIEIIIPEEQVIDNKETKIKEIEQSNIDDLVSGEINSILLSQTQEIDFIEINQTNANKSDLVQNFKEQPNHQLVDNKNEENYWSSLNIDVKNSTKINENEIYDDTSNWMITGHEFEEDWEEDKK
ncbi:AAA domain-containing protein [Mycoplasmopsis felis]|uniref:DEAD/DEAH box helicase n=1 Tax=Mycoplasmopsis felis TaxID=33923 RepID=UPI002AF6A32E|nr:AAA domain-containing protein [Mycoplasmopsis felis]WQQ01913.1 AAA domain-containing protein [Mycoplasmopsis felis]